MMVNFLDPEDRSSGNDMHQPRCRNAEIPRRNGSSLQQKSIQLALKRIVDIAISATSIFILAPVLLIISAALLIEGAGPIFFRQNRWGKDGTIIKIYKFRSMYLHLCDAAGTAQATRNDPRVTKIGRFLRQTNIDELPQLFNVLKGEMSIVGPRCHAIGMLAAGRQYEELVPAYHDRHSMKPGITGLAQARGLRGPTDSAFKSRARIASDLYYVRNFSIMLDIYIIWLTIKAEIGGQGTGF